MPINNWDTSLYDQKHAFVFEYGKGLIPVLQPRPGELILDLGCGTGHLTQTIAESGAHVIGIDSSASMIETAQITYPHLEFLAIPRVNLKRAQAIIQPFCEAHGLSYEVTDPLTAYWQVYSELRRVGNAAIEI